MKKVVVKLSWVKSPSVVEDQVVDVVVDGVVFSSDVVSPDVVEFVVQPLVPGVAVKASVVARRGTLVSVPAVVEFVVPEPEPPTPPVDEVPPEPVTELAWTVAEVVDVE